ncbi:MAG: alpha/beta fold hydrolase [Candidatus Binatus sp.]|uniref:alpha/beta hydrolase n=1 Tax=Candidatus Binatus sp. TaxID=2811406 RepID=UPI00271BE0ED|nr:alpha/beta fold hydrolase [Candidatus Binatus sp.]MDO8432257.1 alpha/beta fold hydrolase [Candidatus Binatus sp.]
MSSSSDEPPSPEHPGVNTDEFFFPGEGVSVLLVHGLTGTPYEMRALGERIAARGARVHGVRLAGHAEAPEALGQVGHENWYESVVQGFEELRRYGDPNVAVGLSMGALLAARLAADQREAVAGLVMLAPAFFLPPATTTMLKAVRMLGTVADKLYLYNSSGSDIHDAGARGIHPQCALMPLNAPLKLLELSALVRPRLAHITQPALVIHARRDHTCPQRKNVNFAMKHLGSAEKRAIVLDESYHVITVDSEKERVASEVIEFVDRFRAVPAARAVG